MATKRTYEFSPDYAIHPGEILGEHLAVYGMSQTDLAARIGMSTKTLSLIVNGKAPVTPETAVQLERVLGVSARLWTGLDTNYRLFEARREAAAEMEKHQEWAGQFPYAELAGRGLVPSTRDTTERVGNLLRFFGVGSVESWQKQYSQPLVAFRQSRAFEPSLPATATWLRLSELRARDVDCAPFHDKAFGGVLGLARGMTRQTMDDEAMSTLRSMCSECGVALVLAAEFKGTHLSGAAQWLTPSKAMLALSLRHGTNDHFWFSFYHEAGHLLYDSKKKVYVDASDGLSDCAAEEQANRFACDTLIPRKAYDRFLETSKVTADSITEFADAIGVAPGIVVGRLQHDGVLPFNRLNHLKDRVALDPA